MVQRTRHVGRAIFFMCLAGALFGLSSVIVKAHSEGVGAFSASFLRSVSGFLLLIVIMRFRGQSWGSFLGVRRGLLFFRGLMGTLGLVTIMWAIPRIDLGVANALNQSSPIFVAVFAGLFLGERFRWQVYVFILIAFIAMIAVVAPDFSSLNMVALVGVSSGFFAGVAYTLVRFLQKSEHSWVIVFWFMGISTIVSGVISVIEGWGYVGWGSVFWLLFTGVIALVAQVFMTLAYRFAEATIVAPFIYVSTIFGFFAGFVVWGEVPDLVSGAGCLALVVCGVGIGQFSRKGGA